MPIFRMPVVLHANCPHANRPHANSPHANSPATELCTADVTISADRAELGCDMCHNFLKMYVNCNNQINVKLLHVISDSVLPILLCSFKNKIMYLSMYQFFLLVYSTLWYISTLPADHFLNLLIRQHSSC